MRTITIFFGALLLLLTSNCTQSKTTTVPTTEKEETFFLPPPTTYNYKKVKGLSLFYREAGDPSKPTIVLLHGYPSSSHSYRNLIPMLATHYHVIAPDNLGSGYSARPNPETTKYTFDVLAAYTEELLNELKIEDYVMYMQDFGAPVGYRMMLKNPKRIKALLVLNATAYLDGLTPKVSKSNQ